MFEALMRRFPEVPHNPAPPAPWEDILKQHEFPVQEDPLVEANPPVDASRAEQPKPISERFSRKNPLVFEGTLDPLMAEEWVSVLERIFDFVAATKREKVICVVYMLRKDARIWWDIARKGHDIGQMEWAEFLTMFNAKYYNQTVIDQKVVEFSNLVQGSSSIHEYVHKFDQLSRFAPDLVDTKANWVCKFMTGLKREKAQFVDIGKTSLDTYDEAIERAICQESWYCPTHSQKGGNDQPKPVGTAPRVYALTQGDNGAGTFDMVSDQLPVANNSAYALMNHGASHSFIVASYVDKIDRKPEPMANICGVSLPSGEDMMVRSWVKVVLVWVAGQELTVDLLVLDLHEYDVIFGMDWLTKYVAMINCKQRNVTFNPPGEEPFVFQGTAREKNFAIISTMKARKLLDDGCISYLANVINKDRESKLQPTEVAVVCKFPEVFPEDLPGIPPDREVEFEIELIPSTACISKAPYQIALAELKELQCSLSQKAQRVMSFTVMHQVRGSRSIDAIRESDETGERKYLGLEEVDQATEDIRSIRQRLQTFIVQQHKYADHCRRPLEFKVQDKIDWLGGLVALSVSDSLAW
ncbi:uncharacterized protein LOC133814821 [Humulus lupulus]|uniref:uncharacterized protein LOC133814821 n=1 Tax=Humulus lupulus TaxID=3486 RepID=UPI002B41453E|nr:uncharacterized protein LOC133814821 [Humulus lupulus]